MKTGVSSYSFRKMINNSETTQLGCVELAKKLGFDGVEFTDLMPHDGSTEEEYAKKLHDECKTAGIQIGSYTFKADLVNGVDVPPEKEVERVKKKLEIAAILGVGVIRHDATWGPKKENGRYTGFEALLPELADKCGEITRHAKSMGIKTTIENHGLFVQDSARVEKLINEVNDANFGVLLDIGNFLCADEDPCMAVGRLAPYTFRVHAKDFHTKSGTEINPGRGWFESRGGNYLRGSIIGHGSVPVAQCLKILSKAGYDGTVSIEFEGMEHPLVGLEVGYENLKRMISALS